MAKRTADPILVTTAERVGRTLGRIAKQLDKVKAIGKAATPAKPRRSAAKSKKQSAASPVKRAMRESWPAQEEAEKVLVKSRGGRPVDERALAHAKDGKRWAARKTR